MMSWKRETCKANRIDVSYLRTGGDKPPIVLLHGLLLSGSCWSSLARELAQEYDVIMPDARGHGYSSSPKGGYTYDILATDLTCFIERLKLINPIILGHSMGGMTAAVVASQKSVRLRAVILADPAFLTPQHQLEVHKSDVANQHRHILAKSKENYLTNIQARHTRRSKELNEQFVQARFQTSVHAFQILTPPNPDYLQLIKALDVPSLLIIGDKGAVVSIEVAKQLSDLNQSLVTVQIEEAGHALPYDQPERFSAVVQLFLRSIII